MLCIPGSWIVACSMIKVRKVSYLPRNWLCSYCFFYSFFFSFLFPSLLCILFKTIVVRCIFSTCNFWQKPKSMIWCLVKCVLRGFLDWSAHRQYALGSSMISSAAEFFCFVFYLFPRREEEWHSRWPLSARMDILGRLKQLQTHTMPRRRGGEQHSFEGGMIKGGWLLVGNG